MHLLILGYSSIVRRRVIPAARLLPGIRQITIASRTHGPADAQHGEADAQHGDPLIAWFGSYDQALAASGADLVYVSGVNSAHATWVMRALEGGLHVMVDKPAFLDLESARSAVALARERKRGLAEATVFPFHPQAAVVQSLIDPGEASSTRVTATLSFPPLPSDDFRYRAECGGGSLYDVGPYAVAANRLVFRAAPASVHCTVLTRGGASNVDTSFSVLLTHDHGGSLVGHFGFVTAYQNRLSVLTRSRAIDAERIFTTPPDIECALKVRRDQDERVIAVPAGDAFVRFLQAFAGATAHGDFAAFESALLEDAALLARLRRAAGVA